jgi:hypothetical protein
MDKNHITRKLTVREFVNGSRMKPPALIGLWRSGSAIGTPAENVAW